MSDFMWWAHGRRADEEQPDCMGSRIEELIAQDLDSDQTINIKFLDQDGKDVLSPDLIHIRKDGVVFAVAITGSTKFSFRSLARMSGGYYVKESTMLNLEEANRRGFAYALLYYDNLGVIRSLAQNTYEDRELDDGTSRRLYYPANFRSYGEVAEIRRLTLAHLPYYKRSLS